MVPCIRWRDGLVTPEAHTKDMCSILKKWEAKPPFDQYLASSGDSHKSRPGNGITFNQSEAPGVDTTKSLDLITPKGLLGHDPQGPMPTRPALVGFQ